MLFLICPNKISDCLQNAKPFSFSPAIVQSILKNLHTVNSQYYQLNAALFSRHLVGLQTPMSVDELQSQIAADKRLQEELRESGFDSGNQSKKRTNSDFESAKIAT
jgi:hypothetical protein